MFDRWRGQPFVVTKLKQLWRLVQESHAQPIAGQTRLAEIVAPNELGVTFIGHSSFLLQLGGRSALVDPVFAKHLILLRRQRHPGLRINEMPAIDVVLLTHAHMDHLNIASLRRIVRSAQMLGKKAPDVVVPWGVEDLVAGLGFSRVHGMKWWEKLQVRGLNVTLTPCKHWGARMFNDTHRGYGGYVIEAAGHSIYHSGDTAYFSGFTEIGQRLHPQVALLPIGAYFPDSYRTVHTSPEEAIRAFVEVGAEWMVPMHFGTFNLGREPMDEPPQRLMAEAARLGISSKVKILEEGETMRLFKQQAEHRAPAFNPHQQGI
jgi:L-ascorbate metabolism protein UlaG (beta-lactamase superfamily)